MKGVHRFGIKGKLAPRYIGPFRIIQQCGPVAYQLELPPHLSSTHDVFHVSQLKKCLRVPTEAVEVETIQLEPSGCATRPGCGSRASSPGAFRVRHASRVR